MSCNRLLQVTDSDLSDALKLVARHYGGKRGAFAYAAFEFINDAYFGNGLPWPLIVWQITPYGSCLGFTTNRGESPPIIALHPSSLKGSEKPNPWGIDPALLGAAYAFDVLIHECTHVSQYYLLGGQQGPTSHNCDNWINEVNRLAPLLGFEDIQAARTKSQRVTIEGEFTKTGKPATKVKKVTGGNIPHTAIAMFPYLLRKDTDPDYYRHNRLPAALSGVL